jgi:Fic family protein
MAVRIDGNWEGWLKFFLRGVAQVSNSATNTARDILKMQEEHRNTIAERVSNVGLGHRLLNFLMQQPIVSVRIVEQQLNCAFATANKLVEQFENSNLLMERTGGQRNRQYAYDPYLALFVRTTR